MFLLKILRELEESLSQKLKKKKKTCKQNMHVWCQEAGSSRDGVCVRVREPIIVNLLLQSVENNSEHGGV